MARETKAERLVREAMEREAYEAELVATYPQRLMAMLERATKVNFELEVREGKFVLTDRSESGHQPVELTLTYSLDNHEGLCELDWQVDVKEEKEREAERRYQLKQSALAKLTKEERDALNLSANW